MLLRSLARSFSSLELTYFVILLFLRIPKQHCCTSSLGSPAPKIVSLNCSLRFKGQRRTSFLWPMHYARALRCKTAVSRWWAKNPQTRKVSCLIYLFLLRIKNRLNKLEHWLVLAQQRCFYVHGSSPICVHSQPNVSSSNPLYFRIILTRSC